MFSKTEKNDKGELEHPTVVMIGKDGKTLWAACYPKGHPPTIV